MARSDRDRFNDHVAVLVRRLGFRLEELPARDSGRLLGEAWQRRLNDHEAALAVGHGQVQRLIEENLERARVLIDRIGVIGEQWRDEDLVDRGAFSALQRELQQVMRRCSR